MFPKGYFRIRLDVRALLCASVLGSLAFTAGCIPTTNLAKPKSGQSPASSNPLSNIFGSTNTGDGAQGQCLNVPAGSAERTYCIACYSSILTARCPGAGTPDACTDRTVAANFNLLVNQCISNSVVAGFSCTRTCEMGTVLNTNTCRCDAPSPSTTGSTGSTGGTTDSGQTDFGPPLVTVSWTSTYTPNDHGTSGVDLLGTPCKSQVPLLFNITNRGNSVPKLNVYAAQNSFPLAPSLPSDPPAATDWLSNILAPQFYAQSSQVRATFDVQTSQTLWAGPNATYGNLNDFFYFDDFETNPASRPLQKETPPAAPVAATFDHSPQLSRFAGPYSGTQKLNLTLTDGGSPYPGAGNFLPKGRYLLTFDLYLLNDWQGTSANNVFQISKTDTGSSTVIFTNTFSSNSTYGQSYSGSAKAKDTHLGPASLAYTGLDAIYHLNVIFNHDCTAPATACSLPLVFEGANLTDRGGAGTPPGKPYWGVDNLALMPLRELAIKYTFTDTNQLTSAYCVWLETYSSCENTGSGSGVKQCSCWAGPKRNGSSGEIFAATFADPLVACPTTPFAAAFPTTPKIDFAAEGTWDAGGANLIGGTHTQANCTDADPAGLGGTVQTDPANNWRYCQIVATACPAGWTEYTAVTPPAGDKACY